MKNQEENQSFLEDLITNSISQIKQMSQSNTIIGDPIVSPSGNILIPVSKVSVGYVVGGGQYNSVNKKMPYPLAGGNASGVSISPIGFIVETDTDIKFIDIENKNAYQTILNLVNAIISKFDEKKDNNNED